MKEAGVKRKKTSRFKGVSWDSRTGRWYASYQPAGFQRRFRTEEEAAAHYNALLWALHPEWWNEKHIHRFNKLRQGLSGYKSYWDADGTGPWRRLDIAPETFVILDGSDELYSEVANVDWFLRDGEPWTIVDYDQRTKIFKYVSLRETVYGGPCQFRSGDGTDCRSQNLAPLDWKPEIRNVRELFARQEERAHRTERPHPSAFEKEFYLAFATWKQAGGEEAADPRKGERWAAFRRFEL